MHTYIYMHTYIHLNHINVISSSLLVHSTEIYVLYILTMRDRY